MFDLTDEQNKIFGQMQYNIIEHLHRWWCTQVLWQMLNRVTILYRVKLVFSDMTTFHNFLCHKMEKMEGHPVILQHLFLLKFYHIYVIQMDNYDERWRVPNLNVHTSSFISYGRYGKNINSPNSHFCRDKTPVIRIIGTCKWYLNTTST